jgi:NAD(P)-dependent dehydrogenase (short-subunit alcohol dehydrogenase family)
MELQDTIAVVTGGARGIGRGMALALARQGVHVAVADLYTPSQGTAGYALSTEQEVTKTVGELTALGVRAIGVPVDVTQWAQVQTMVETVTQRLGPIAILCNNAGLIDTALVVETTEAQWDTMMQVNVKGVFLCCKAVAPGMMARRQGRIINTASIAGKRGGPRTAAYCASKFAVIGFTQAFAPRWRPIMSRLMPYARAFWGRPCGWSTCSIDVLSAWGTIGRRRLHTTRPLSCRLAARRLPKILAKPWCIWRAQITSPALP